MSMTDSLNDLTAHHAGDLRLNRHWEVRLPGNET